MNKSSEGFIQIIILIIFAIVIFVGIGYLAHKVNLVKLTPPTTQNPTLLSPTPKQNQTQNSKIENWNTYTDAEYHYSIKYPSNWTKLNNNPPSFIFPASGAAKYYLSIRPNNNPNNTYDTNLFRIWEPACIGNCPEGEGDETRLKAGVDYQLIDPAVEKRIINNNITTYYITSYYKEVSVVIPIPNKKMYLLINPNVWPENESRLFDQILSTFRFLD